MENLLIINKGFAQTGKSAAIKAVWEKFIEMDEAEVITINEPTDKLNDGDVTAIVQYTHKGKTIFIGIESQGDPDKKGKKSSVLENSIRLFADGDLSRIPNDKVGLKAKEELIAYNYSHCDIIIAPCRANGETHTQLIDLEKSKGYRLLYYPHAYYQWDNKQRKYTNADMQIHDYLNRQYAERVVEMINRITLM